MLSALKLGLITALVATLAMITISIFNMTEALKKTYQVSAHLDALKKTARIIIIEEHQRFEAAENEKSGTLHVRQRTLRLSSTPSELH